MSLPCQFDCGNEAKTVVYVSVGEFEGDNVICQDCLGVVVKALAENGGMYKVKALPPEPSEPEEV